MTYLIKYGYNKNALFKSNLGTFKNLEDGLAVYSKLVAEQAPFVGKKPWFCKLVKVETKEVTTTQEVETSIVSSAIQNGDTDID